ncbi:PLP-dependent aminotransferase family protein [Paenibacillus sp. N1-5-1-14]|uniref:aminotransferase-like domain-containing protein n=1 Tax=Paenibacillus radicibacter TaxID=2972488 RepID=UPI0021591F18|nr:PLP-dependent aminotransferase family protein [Paenibacillus radicibacter]MCR8645649.1 PLP-dependent aminotransferase family protein [Paenibacillus radicibacter]
MNYQFSKSLDGFSSSAVRDILKLTQGKSIISFAGGLPAEELFPIEAVREAVNRVMDQGKGALQYGLTEGYIPLRQSIAKWMGEKGINVSIDEMLITTGSQQAIDLLTRIYIDPGDVILVEEPTYLAAIQVFQSRGAKIVSVRGDQDGLDPDDLKAKIKEHNPKLAYVIPTFSNPTGKVWSLERRQSVLNICQEANVLILEDDPYGEIKFGDTETYPSIFALSGKAEGSCVVYTSTFSKTVAPALRTGWVVGDADLIRNMTRMKQAADLHSSTLDQQTLYQLMEHFDLNGHIRTIRAHYESRMRIMADLLKEKNWPGVTWVEPKGGMFFWVELPEGMRATDLLPKAVEQGVAFVPGSPFYAGDAKHNTMRLNYTHSDEESLREGMNRLDRAIQSMLAVK